MGVVHKLKPEILNFILENKQRDPSLSCRTLTQLIFEQLQIKVSKSSINSIFKEHNLSMPSGRRQKEKKKKFNMPLLPNIEVTRAIMSVDPVVDQQETPDEKFTNEIVVPLVSNDAGDTIPTQENEVIPEKEVILPQEIEPAITQGEEEITAEEKRIREAEEWAKRLHEEERARIEKKLEFEKQQAKDEKQKADESEMRALLEEAVKVKEQEEEKARRLEQEEAEKNRLEQEAIAKAEAEKKRIEEEVAAKAEAERKRLEADRKQQEEEAVAKAEAEKKRLEQEAIAKAEAEKKQQEEDKLAAEAALKIEKEKWARISEEEQKARQQGIKEAAVMPAISAKQESKGAILIKALDYLIGGSKKINDIISKGMGVSPESILPITEEVIFKSLFGKDDSSGNSQEKIDSFNLQIKQLGIKPDIIKAIQDTFLEARGVKVHFVDGSAVHLDGQFYSVWSTPYIPFDFSSTVYETKKSLNNCFFEGHPLVLLSTPGYDVMPKDFFSLLLNIGSTNKYPDSLTVFGNKVEEIEKISLNNKRKYSLLFGLWPWQYTGARKVKRIGEFHPKHIEGIDKDFYLAEIEIDVLRVNQVVNLKGVAIKLSPAEKIRLVVLTNAEAQMDIDNMAQIYLSRWPNLDEAFHDYTRKIEIFSYVSNAEKLFSKDNCGVDIQASNLESEGIFEGYIKMLDCYLRWHFLPPAYVEKNFKFTFENFYKMPVTLFASKQKVTARIQPEPGYQYVKDLEYLIRRLNEREIILQKGERLWFESAFK